MSGGRHQGPWTVGALLAWTAPYFEEKGAESPRLDAELLLAEVLGCDRLRLYLDHDRPVDATERAAFRTLVERRAAGEPVAYLLGRREFYGRTFHVDARVLVPRPETEHLVDEILSVLPEDLEGSLLDLCSGSGCIGITLLCERPGLEVTAVEISEAAAALAEENARRLGVAGRYHQIVGDLFGPIEADASFVAITANPPYVAAEAWERLPPEVRAEPREALLAGAGGLEVARRILEGARAHLRPGAPLLLEHGEEQAAALSAHAEALGYRERRTIRDLADRDRILLALR